MTKNLDLFRSIFYLALVFVSFDQILKGQDTKPEPCPAVTINGPPSEPKINEVENYSALVDKKGVYRETSYVWSAIGGEIVRGQGTTNASVKRTDEDFLVSIRVNGFRPRCERDFQEKRLDFTPPEAFLLNRIVGPISEGDEDKIKSFVDNTRTNTKQVFWVIGCQKKDVDRVETRRQSLLDLFDKFGRIGHDARLTFVSIEAEEDFIEFWRTTANSQPPALAK
jgi:hypothetical protein